ncbi:MAG: FAD-dependent oxidoreductase [Acidobacteria bacterium]|nr:FAD-dependent oxidoreductase [Acidobacteriota bacterium]
MGQVPMPTNSATAANARDAHEVRQSSCCVVGGGPGGVLLALLLARRGIDVTLLEAHQDFDREFRGDTIHPSVLEYLDQLGLSDALHQLRHAKIYGPTIQTADGPFQPFDFRLLKTRFPYIMVMPQTRFLEFLTRGASQYPNFHLVMGANVHRLIEEDGRVCGVQYMSKDSVLHEVRAPLTVGADGRFSRVRQLAGLQAVKTSPPMDVLWFRLPRLASDMEESTGLLGRFANGYVLAIIAREDCWQLGLVFRKGLYHELRDAGIEALRRTVVDLEPRFGPHVEHLKDWQELSLLSVESSRCPRWYREGLLLIGDAAHVMSPVGGVGINYAIQDAVAAANILKQSLLAGSVTTEHLAEVQRTREFPTLVIQQIQSFMQERVLLNVLNSDKLIRIPAWVRMLLRVPAISKIPAWLLAFGVNRPRVEDLSQTADVHLVN